MAKKKKLLTRRFCNSCQKRTIFNKTKDDKLVCSRCGITFKDGKEGKDPKVLDVGIKEKFKYLI